MHCEIRAIIENEAWMNPVSEQMLLAKRLLKIQKSF